jgi:hypothetical protein
MAGDALQRQIDELQAALNFDMRKAAWESGQRGGGGGSGGGGATVNLDLRNSVITPNALDNLLMPALERALLRATGKLPDFRVKN